MGDFPGLPASSMTLLTVEQDDHVVIVLNTLICSSLKKSVFFFFFFFFFSVFPSAFSPRLIILSSRQSIFRFVSERKKSNNQFSCARSRSGKSWLEETRCWWWQEQWDVISRSVPFDYWWFFLVLCHCFLFPLRLLNVKKMAKKTGGNILIQSFSLSLSLDEVWSGETIFALPLLIWSDLHVVLCCMSSVTLVSLQLIIFITNLIDLRPTMFKTVNACDLISGVHLQAATYTHSVILRVQPLVNNGTDWRTSTEAAGATTTTTTSAQVRVREVIKSVLDQQWIRIDDLIHIRIKDDHLDQTCWHLLRRSAIDLIIFLNRTSNNEQFDLIYPPVESTYRVREHIDAVLNSGELDLCPWSNRSDRQVCIDAFSLFVDVFSLNIRPEKRRRSERGREAERKRQDAKQTEMLDEIDRRRVNRASALSHNCPIISVILRRRWQEWKKRNETKRNVTEPHSSRLLRPIIQSIIASDHHHRILDQIDHRLPSLQSMPSDEETKKCADFSSWIIHQCQRSECWRSHRAFFPHRFDIRHVDCLDELKSLFSHEEARQTSRTRRSASERNRDTDAFPLSVFCLLSFRAVDDYQR